MAGQPNKNRGWLWYFVILAILTVAATAGLIAYNLRQQLTPQKLQEARQLWQANGPRDYDLDYTVQSRTDAEFHVKVRSGKVVYAEPDNHKPEEKQRYYGMPKLFDYIEDFLDQDRELKRQTFTLAAFDPEDGHLIRYIRRVTGTDERVEIVVKFTRVTEHPAEDSGHKER